MNGEQTRHESLTKQDQEQNQKQYQQQNQEYNQGPKKEFEISGKDVTEGFQSFFKEINKRRIFVHSRNKEKLMEIPLLFVLIIGIFAPWLIVIGFLLFLFTNCAVSLRKVD